MIQKIETKTLENTGEGRISSVSLVKQRLPSKLVFGRIFVVGKDSKETYR